MNDKDKKCCEMCYQDQTPRRDCAICPCHTEKKGWEIKFNKLWKELGLHLGYANNKDEKIKSFISDLLKERDEMWRERIEKVDEIFWVGYKKGVDMQIPAVFLDNWQLEEVVEALSFAKQNILKEIKE